MGHQLRIEMVYRVYSYVDVDEEHYPANTFGKGDDTKFKTDLDFAKAAMEYEIKKDEEDAYEFFSEQIESEGPDGWFYQVSIVDGNGDILETKVHEDTNEAMIAPEGFAVVPLEAHE